MPLKIYFTRINGRKMTVVAMSKRGAMGRYAEMGYIVTVPQITIAGQKPKRMKKKGPGKKSRPEGNNKKPR